ncbi:phage major capsid protein [Clostridium lacusfryxellense]|uniref:phage major capsid protein n=1 Tax=Clostridium lacusfryxellense TaxID=205328 RepID=UPI001C0E6A9D|nr:hypothetical protein [Clostridium lacusfryxellense]MBU3112124.1 hypothetical protein [Clostridium lacusfryxellense]
MSVNSFKKQLWEGSLLANFHSVSIAEAITTAPVDVNGSKVTFNRVGTGAIKDYTGAIAWDTINTTPIELIFAQKKYFAFSLDDADKVQLAGDVLNATTLEHAQVLAEVIDAYVLGVAQVGVKTANKIGLLATPISITKVTQAYDLIVDLGTKLSKSKTPVSDRFVVVNADYLNLLQKDARFTLNPVVLANGLVDGVNINGMAVVISEEVGAGKVVAMHKSAIGFGKQLDEMEALRLQTAFADGIRGLAIYDACTLRDDAVAVLFYTVALV